MRIVPSAEAAGSSGRTWRAYLSAHATDSSPAINARERIGFGIMRMGLKQRRT